MAEYIEREDAIKVAEKYGLANGSVLGRHTGLADCIASEIASIPAADVEEVRHGHWMYKRIGDRGQTNCSVCGKRNSTDSVFENPCKPYCPNCGAKMDEEDEQWHLN